jgi:phosphoribosylformylglycinamidine synthase
MKAPNVCIIRAAGTNCDQETAFAFSTLGAQVKLVHVNKLIKKQCSLDDYHIAVLPGGFSYGDDISAGKVMANELKSKLRPQIERFVSEGKLIIGICNGFQILVKTGLLPGNQSWEQDVSLVINDSGSFQAEWVYLKTSVTKGKPGKCVWTGGIDTPVYLPIAHGAGKFVPRDTAVLQRLKKQGQIVLQYCDRHGNIAEANNPNGSAESVAGICDETGRIFGLMPHPERHFSVTQHPAGSSAQTATGFGDGYLIFKNGVEYAAKHLVK